VARYDLGGLVRFLSSGFGTAFEDATEDLIVGDIFGQDALLDKGSDFGVGKSVKAFARGGQVDRGMSATMGAIGAIIDRPTLFENGGQAALVGEGAAKEGIFPLDKTSAGALGIGATVVDRSGNAKQTIAPIQRQPNGNLGVRIDKMARGGVMQNRLNTASAPLNVQGGGRSHGPSSTQSATASTNDDGSKYTIVVNVREPRTRHGARRAGATVARKISETLGKIS
jgi:hypothetical protein